MSRGYRFAVVGVFWVFAFAVHYIGITMFAPDTALWDLGDIAISAGFIDPGWREQLYFLFAQAAPLLLLGFSTAWLFASEYEAQTVTRRRP